MTPVPLPEDFETMLVFAEETADVLAEDPVEPHLGQNAETLLRASIAAATLARDAYLAMVEGAAESSVARRVLVRAKVAQSRTEQQLRGRLAGLIAEICLLQDDDLFDLVGHAPSLSG
jgi:hypothetical protein